MIAHGRGSVVNLSLTYGVVSADPRIYGDSGLNSPVSYAASKAAVINLSRYLAIHWREKNVRVNCLVPGGVYDRQDEGFVRQYLRPDPAGKDGEGRRLRRRGPVYGFPRLVVHDRLSGHG